MTSSNSLRLDSPVDRDLAPSAAATDLDRWLTLCIDEDASDLHIAAGVPPYLRIHGQLAPIDGHVPLADAIVEQLAADLARRGGRVPLGVSGSLDGAMSSREGARFRYNIYRRQGQFAIALRRLEERFRTLSELGLPDELYS